MLQSLFIVINDNGGSPKDRIEFAFESKEEAEVYANKMNNQQDLNEYSVQEIYLLKEEEQK